MGHPSVEVAFVLSNKKEAPVIEKSQLRNIETIILSNDLVSQGSVLIDICNEKKIDYVILAGYLRLIPKDFIQFYHERIINIHPSLLPKYGGQGMYGNNVHNAVLTSKEAESGISIHFIDEDFDKGRLIAQFHCAVQEEDTLETLKKKIQQLEHAYFPVVIEKTVLNLHHV